MASQVDAKRQTEEKTGVSNVTYDLLTVLQNKLTGVAAIEEYKIDAKDHGDNEAMQLFEEPPAARGRGRPQAEGLHHDEARPGVTRGADWTSEPTAETPRRRGSSDGCRP